MTVAKRESISDERKHQAEEQVVTLQREVDYDTKEYPVETIVLKYLDGLEEDTNELYLPDYQRDFTWDTTRQSKFIESVLLGLPIPYIFVADAPDSTRGEGRLEIVDGSQRIRTLVSFSTNKLELHGLEKLSLLNGFRFRDLLPSRQRRFNRRPLRMIELTERATEEIRRDIFERINTGSDELRQMEKRRGIIQGKMIDFLDSCAKESLFLELVPLPEAAVRRREREELILRFFAYLDRYQTFKHSVVQFLDDFVREKNDNLGEKAMRDEFIRMLAFVKQHFPSGFRKAPTHARTSRIRFEALAVGTALALRVRPKLVPSSVAWLDSKDFKKLTTSDASNSRVKVINRIEYVRDALLGAARK